MVAMRMDQTGVPGVGSLLIYKINSVNPQTISPRLSCIWSICLYSSLREQLLQGKITLLRSALGSRERHTKQGSFRNYEREISLHFSGNPRSLHSDVKASQGCCQDETASSRQVRSETAGVASPSITIDVHQTTTC